MKTTFSMFMLVILSISTRADFIAEPYITGQSFITTIAVSPDGRMYFIEKNTGTIKIVLGENAVRPEPFFDFDVNSNGERGGLGLTFHPDYPDSPYVYAYATIPQPVLANVVVRLVDSAGYGTNPDTIFRAPITVGASNHNGGNLRFGPDAKLYITIGENGQGNWAQDTCRVQGKIIRINYDGSIPDDNPINCSPIYAYGLRNSFDFCFHPGTGAIYASENGPEANDEINRIIRGGNYGWPIVQCRSSNDNYIDALWCWTPTIAPTGIIVPWNSNIPEFNGQLLMTDWNTGTLHSLVLNSAGDSILSDSGVYSIGIGLTDVEQGADGNIYLSTFDGRIFRLRAQTSEPQPFPLREPGRGERVVNFDTRFVWGNTIDSDGPVHFELEFSIDTLFANPFFSFDNGGDTTMILVTDSLFHHASNMFWRVAAIDSSGHIRYGGIPQPEHRALNVLPPGDANADGATNGNDVVFMVNYFKGFGPAPSPLEAADANGNCIVNGIDTIYLVNFFKGGISPLRGNCGF